MFGLDDRIASLGGGDALLVVLAVALLLGLRHATDPDHLAAVSMLIAGERDDGVRRATVLGLAWGVGHATTLIAFGLPIVLFKAYLPAGMEQAAEALIGLVIVALAVRMLARWRSGRFHVHTHRHGALEHRHLHPHAETAHEHSHAHEHAPAHEHRHEPDRRLGRSPLQAFGIGLVHGMGGSAGVGVLLLAGIPDHAEASVALVLFAVATALSMTMLSSGLGWTLTRGTSARRAFALAPALGVASLAFGVWYTLGALHAVGYPL
jgi:ABC-type nickel/cobalt efflux system permease component RcnA